MADGRLPCVRAGSSPLHVVVLGEDTEQVQARLLPALRSRGLQVHGVASALELYRTLLARRFDIAVLDTALPDGSGFHVAQHLRAMLDIGIVMLAGKDRRQDLIKAFECGADSCLPKPADPDLLTAMLHNLGRRLSSRVSMPPPTPSHSATWRVDADGWRLVSPGGHSVMLTAAEQRIVKLLTSQSNHPVARETLIEAIAHDTYEFDPHRLDMVVHRLRRKALTLTGETLPLRTVRGRGYLLSCDVESPMHVVRIPGRQTPS